jgi:hypothetical protein
LRPQYNQITHDTGRSCPKLPIVAQNSSKSST